MKKLLLVIVLMFCGIFSVKQVSASVQLAVTTDAFIWDLETSGVLDGIPDAIMNTNAVVPGTGILSSGTALDARGIMVFDIASYAGYSLQSASLSGWGYRTDHIQNGSIDVNVSSYAGDGIITFNDFDRPALFQGQFSLSPPDVVWDPTYQQFSLDVTAGMAGLLDDAENYAEFRLTADGLSAYIAAGDAANGWLDLQTPGYPMLTLNFAPSVPEPATIVLMGMGLIGLAARRKV